MDVHLILLMCAAYVYICSPERRDADREEIAAPLIEFRRHYWLKWILWL